MVFPNIPSFPPDSSHIFAKTRYVVTDITEAISSLAGQVADLTDYFLKVCSQCLDPVDLIPKIGVVRMVVLDLTLDNVNLLIHLLEEASVLVSSFSAFTLTDESEGQVKKEKGADCEEAPQVVHLSPAHWLSSPPDLLAFR